MHPHLDQLDRDRLDDHNLVDQKPAGDDPDSRTVPVIPVLPAPAGTARNTTNR